MEENNYAHEIETEFRRKEEVNKEFTSKSGRRKVSRHIEKRKKSNGKFRIKSILDYLEKIIGKTK